MFIAGVEVLLLCVSTIESGQSIVEVRASGALDVGGASVGFWWGDVKVVQGQ